MAGDNSGPILASTGDKHAPASNTAAIVLYAATADLSHAITGVYWSYDATPTGGRLFIEDGTNVVTDFAITTAGAGFIPFPRGKRGSINTLLRVTLAAGGSGVTGRVGVLGHETVT